MQFVKMEATGNDFVVLDNREGQLDHHSKDFWERVCDRKFGVGADGVLMVEASDEGSNADFRMRYLNADGGEVSMCGNGARAIGAYARFVLDLPYNDHYLVQTMNALYRFEVESFESVKVLMVEHYDDQRFQTDDLIGNALESYFVNTGVEHSIFLLDQVENIPLEKWGAAVRYDQRFPAGSNANFVEQIKPDEIRMRTYERGVEGETLACGTGAVAAAVFQAKRYPKVSEVKVHMPGGLLKIVVDMDKRQHFLCGPANIVFRGEYVDK